MGLRMSFSKQAKTTGPARAYRRPYPRRPTCAHKRSSIPTNAATDRPTGQTDRPDRPTERQTDRQTDRRQTDRQQTKSDDYRQIDKQTNQQSGRTDNQTDKAEGQTDRRRPTEWKDMTDITPTRLPESIAVYGNRSHRQSRSLPLARALLSHVAAALMPTHAALCVSRSRTHTIVFS